MFAKSSSSNARRGSRRASTRVAPKNHGNVAVAARSSGSIRHQGCAVYSRDRLPRAWSCRARSTAQNLPRLETTTRSRPGATLPRSPAHEIEHQGPHDELARMSQKHLEHPEEVVIEQDHDRVAAGADQECRPYHQPFVEQPDVHAVRDRKEKNADEPEIYVVLGNRVERRRRRAGIELRLGQNTDLTSVDIQLRRKVRLIGPRDARDQAESLIDHRPPELIRVHRGVEL